MPQLTENGSHTPSDADAEVLVLVEPATAHKDSRPPLWTVPVLIVAVRVLFSRNDESHGRDSKSGQVAGFRDLWNLISLDALPLYSHEDLMSARAEQAAWSVTCRLCLCLRLQQLSGRFQMSLPSFWQPGACS